MKKAFKIIGKILLVIIILLIIFLLIVFTYNKIMMNKEKALLDEPLGEMIEVDGHNMCIYSEGEGKHTLVFLSGSGTASPILDFRSLYSLLVDDYRIVVVEKFGYGFSDVVNTERSFDTILRQDREALSKAGIDAPFILCPHSMSGLEAILWAQEYPDEVEAFIVDHAGNTRRVVTSNPNLYNIAAREFQYNSADATRATMIETSSTAVIHLIDKPLMINN